MKTHSHGYGLCPYTDGLCRAHQEQLRIVDITKKHVQIRDTRSGFLVVCTCGEAIDSYSEHLLKLIKGETK